MHKKGFSKDAVAEMEMRFYKSAMPRHIPAGETRSGYVFTHSRPGTKSFNVDLYGNEDDYNFAFFVTVPGFVPDHKEINFNSLYPQNELQHYDLTGLKQALENQTWVTSSKDGKAGLPISVVVVGNGLDALKALLRGGWYEQPSTRDIVDESTAYFMFGRLPDATFRIQLNNKRERNELYMWQTPMRVNGEIVWMGRVAHFIGQRTQLEQVLFGARIDPDVDEGRDYFLQNMWYSQSLEQMAWLKVGDHTSFGESKTDFNGLEYFSDGHISISWLSGVPISLVETNVLDWDVPPHKR